MFSKEVLSTMFKVFDMTRPGIELRSPEHSIQKYYQIQMIFKQIYLTNETLTGTVTPGKSVSESNGKEGITHTPKIYTN